MSLGDQIKINIREDKIIHMQVKVYIAGLTHIKGPVLQKSVAGANLEFSKGGGHRERRGREFSRGVWGHAPPENFENLSL